MITRLKDLVFRIPFIRNEIARVREVERILAFRHASDDLKETNTYDTEERAKQLTEQRLIELLSVVDPKRIVTIDKNNRSAIYIGGKLADEGRLANLKSEAEFLIESDLWGILTETPKDLAHKALFVEGDNLDTMKKGRSMLFTLDTQKKVVEIFKSYSHPSRP